MKNQSAKLTLPGIKYLIRLFFQLFIQIIVMYITAGTLHLPIQIYVYIAIMIINYLSCMMIIIRYNPEVLNERIKNIKVNTKSWDKVLLTLYVVFTFLIINVCIGLSIRFQWAFLDSMLIYPGILLYSISVVISCKALIGNKHFEASSRIQSDRNQKVVSNGIYSVVRHPGYAAIIIWAISIPLLTGILYSVIPSVCIIVIITIRTILEDNMLRKELDGYPEYTHKVKYRLIPYIW